MTKQRALFRFQVNQLRWDVVTTQHYDVTRRRHRRRSSRRAERRRSWPSAAEAWMERRARAASGVYGARAGRSGSVRSLFEKSNFSRTWVYRVQETRVLVFARIRARLTTSRIASFARTFEISRNPWPSGTCRLSRASRRKPNLQEERLTTNGESGRRVSTSTRWAFDAESFRFGEI